MAADKDVLEVAAGAGMGLGLLARKARRVVGTDITPGLIRRARETYTSRVEIAAADAQRLPFRDASFDVVILYEAVYYLPHVDAFFQEACRVLREGGLLLVCTANKRRAGFVRSPHSHAYYDADELSALYMRNGFASPVLLGAFPAAAPSLAGRLLLWGFGVADRLRLVPRSLEGRERFKRMLYGELVPTPAELGDDSPLAAEPAPLAGGAIDQWKVIYAVGSPSATTPRRAP